jgi:hypothetical protein
MSARETDGRAESIRQRLRNALCSRGEDVTLGLQRYAVERFLYRLGASGLRDRFVLKGAMLLRLWSEQPYRPHAQFKKVDLDARQALYQKLAERIWNPAVLDEEAAS